MRDLNSPETELKVVGHEHGSFGSSGSISNITKFGTIVEEIESSRQKGQSQAFCQLCLVQSSTFFSGSKRLLIYYWDRSRFHSMRY